MDLLTVALGGFVLLFLYLVRHLTKNRGHLETLGIPLVKPMGLLGSPPFAFHKFKLHEEYQNKFRKFGTKTYGRYDGIIPVVVTMDPDLVKSVLVKNFDSFSDLVDMHIDDKHSTLDISGGERWKDLRKNLSPTFTSGKLKAMLEPMAGVADLMMEEVDRKLGKNNDREVDAKQLFQGLAVNTIARCAFGVEANAYADPEQDLIKYGVQIFADFRAKNWAETIIAHMFSYFPGFEKLIPLWPPAFDKVFDISKDIMEQRNKKNIKLNDFVDRLTELREAKIKNPNGENIKALTDDSIVAQSVIFFIAGFETTSNTLSTTCYNLAKNPQVQERLFDEIQEVLEAHDGKLDHETINDMDYLEAVINEDLRISGPVTLHFRHCTKDCEIAPGMLIKKGMRVEMPIYACHHNPEFYPEPEEFRPERFLKENAKEIVPYTFRPFGGGPRLCIGQRFALVEMKLALAKLLAKYRVIATDKTKLEPLEGDQFLIGFSDMPVKFEKRMPN